MKNFRSLVAVAVILVIGLISCSKGSTGPAGPAGPAGAAGPDSVTYSSWIPLQFAYDAADTVFTDTLIAPSITKAILDSGVILSYVNAQGSDGIYHIIPTGSLNTLNIFEDFSIGKINIVSYNDYSTLPYRYVTIPGSLKTGNSTGNIKVKGYTIQELKAMSYEQVQQVLAN
jgi:hypothetical protein